MKQPQTELYNALRDRLNELLPERLELRFGCEFISPKGEQHFIYHCSQNHPFWLEAKTDGTNCKYLDFEKKGEFKILGTPPTFQEVLLAIDIKYRHKNGYREYLICTDGYLTTQDDLSGTGGTNGLHYVLTLPLSEQSPETLEAILTLLEA